MKFLAALIAITFVFSGTDASARHRKPKKKKVVIVKRGPKRPKKVIIVKPGPRRPKKVIIVKRKHPRRRPVVVVRPRPHVVARPARRIYVFPLRAHYPRLNYLGATTFLGATSLADWKDYDRISLPSCATYANQRVSKVKMHALRYGAEIDYVTLNFQNGGSQNLNIREFYAPGSSTRWIDLRGANRCIRSIEVFGDTETAVFDNSRQAKVLFYGL